MATGNAAGICARASHAAGNSRKRLGILSSYQLSSTSGRPPLYRCPAAGRHSSREGNLGLPKDSHGALLPIDTESEEIVGPRGALMIGFAKEEGLKLRKWFAAMDPDFYVSFATNEMLTGSLREALVEDGAFRRTEYAGPLASLTPRILLFSGMTGQEVVGICEFWEDSGLPTPNFTMLLPDMLPRPMAGVIEEVINEVAAQVDPARKKGIENMLGKVNLDEVRGQIRNKMSQRKSRPRGKPTERS